MDSGTSEDSPNVTESEIEFGLKIIESMPKMSSDPSIYTICLIGCLTISLINIDPVAI